MDKHNGSILRLIVVQHLVLAITVMILLSQNFFSQDVIPNIFLISTIIFYLPIYMKYKQKRLLYQFQFVTALVISFVGLINFLTLNISR